MSEPLKTQRFLDFGPFRLDRESKVLLRGQTIVPLTPKAFETLSVLVQNRGTVMSKDQLIQAVWPDTFVEESNLAQHISVLRKTLGQNGNETTYIETVSKRGYRFVAEVGAAGVTASPEPPQLSNKPDTVSSPNRRRVKFSIVAAALALLCTALAAWQFSRRSDIPVVSAIAVLPLANLSGDSGQDYFANGITELLTTELSKTFPLRVISRNSALRLQNSGKPLPEAARDLGVDAVLEGSVALSGNRMRLTARLVHARSGRVLWAESYDWELTDVLTLQREIVRSAAHAIRLRTAPRRDASAPSRPIHRAAFEDFLRARYYLDQRTAESVPKAAELFRRSIDEDPAYARAYAGLADCYNQLGTVMLGGQSPANSRKLAMAAAKRALEIEPDLAEAHAALGYSNLYEWNWEQARSGLESAIKLNPNYAPAHLWLAHLLAARRNFDEALQEVRVARDLDPLSPIIQTQVGWILSKAARFAGAIVEYKRALHMEPGFPWAMWQMGNALREAGDAAAAIQILEEAVKPERSPSALGALGRAYASAGRRGDAERVLRELIALSRSRYVPPHCFVDVYWGLRDKERVFEWLERSREERSNSLLWMNTWTDTEWLRADPRFASILSSAGLQ